jgi:hypothetical protein
MAPNSYTKAEKHLIEILTSHPNSTISEMKMIAGFGNHDEIPRTLNRLRVKGILQQANEQPPRYSIKEAPK